MADPERAFRDALRRADYVKVPVAPIDPEDLASRPRHRQAPRWLGGLAAAAALVLVAGGGIGLWLSAGSGSTPALPGATPTATVDVGLYSGRANPVVMLGVGDTQELYATLAERAADLEPAEPAESPLGSFQGFFVRSGGEQRPALQILPGSVYVDGDSGLQLLRDPSAEFFDLVADALPADLFAQVADRLVQVRIRNAGPSALAAVQVSFPDNQVVDYGALAAGEESGHRLVAIGYRYAVVVASADGEQVRWQPRDFVGETPLPPGRYSYTLSVQDGRLELVFSEDPTQEVAEPTPAPTATR